MLYSCSLNSPVCVKISNLCAWKIDNLCGNDTGAKDDDDSDVAGSEQSGDCSIPKYSNATED